MPSGSRENPQHIRRRAAGAHGTRELRRNRQGSESRLHARGGAGDYVIVHVGFAISRLDEAEAHRVFEYLREIDELKEIEESAG